VARNTFRNGAWDPNEESSIGMHDWNAVGYWNVIGSAAMHPNGPLDLIPLNAGDTFSVKIECFEKFFEVGGALHVKVHLKPVMQISIITMNFDIEMPYARFYHRIDPSCIGSMTINGSALASISAVTYYVSACVRALAHRAVARPRRERR
jgi:hypothetical protein